MAVHLQRKVYACSYPKISLSYSRYGSQFSAPGEFSPIMERMKFCHLSLHAEILGRTPLPLSQIYLFTNWILHQLNNRFKFEVFNVYEMTTQEMPVH